MKCSGTFLGKTILCHKSLSRAMIHGKEWRTTQLHPTGHTQFQARSSVLEQLSSDFPVVDEGIEPSGPLRHLIYSQAPLHKG